MQPGVAALCVAFWITAFGTQLFGSDGNRLVYLDAPCDPYYVHREFPRLITPQWVGEEGVEAVIILSIDDMRDPATYEAYLRPILQRLKKIDGRAPVSIMTNQVDPNLPFLQAWIDEGLSLEAHTIDHPCPCLQGGDFAKAAKTYHDCVDLLASIPNNQPVAFRMPCCDSRNTPSPRFWSEIFDKTSNQGHFLRIDSSVFNIITPKDTSLPRDLVLNEEGESRFHRYLPFPSFVNTIEDYPYPYVIGGLSWQFSCVVPSDWQAQHVQRSNNPDTVADMKRALDATVLKQGVFTLVFHPHGWIRNDQIVELIDYADQKYGRRVRFLNFRESAQRLQDNLLAGETLRAPDGGDNGVRILDLNNDKFLDVAIGNRDVRTTQLWSPQKNRWRKLDMPTLVVETENDQTHSLGVQFGVIQPSGNATMLVRNQRVAGAWHFTESGWSEDQRLLHGLNDRGNEILTSRDGIDQGVRMRDVDRDGCCELIAGGPTQQAVFRWDRTHRTWRAMPFKLPAGTGIVDRQGRDAGVRFVDIDGDRRDDVLLSNSRRWAAYLFDDLESGWARGIEADRSEDDLVPPIVRGTTNNGAWFHSGHLWVQNEDTHQLPDGVARLPISKLLERIDAAGKTIRQK